MKCVGLPERHVVIVAKIAAVLCCCCPGERNAMRDPPEKCLSAIYVYISGSLKSGQNLVAMRVLTSISHSINPVLDPVL